MLIVSNYSGIGAEKGCSRARVTTRGIHTDLVCANFGARSEATIPTDGFRFHDNVGGIPEKNLAKRKSRELVRMKGEDARSGPQWPSKVAKSLCRDVADLLLELALSIEANCKSSEHPS
jgi:hypothetical protein